MSTHAHVGLSHAEDARVAGAAAASEAVNAMPGRRADVALVFATADYDHDAMLRAVMEALPGAQVLGCSGEGVIARNESVESTSAVAVMAVASDRMRFEAFLIDDYGIDPPGAGQRLGTIVAGRPDARCLCLMPDGLHGNCTTFLQALHAELGGRVPVVGGTAADAMAFERTYQYGAGRVVTGGLAALLIAGDAEVEIGVSHGCSPIGLERTVTRANDGWVQEIDGQSSWSLFREYLDGDARDLNAEGIVHLCLGQPLPGEAARSYDPYVIRTPLQLDPHSGALFFPGGGLETGSVIQLTRRDPERIRESARQCAQQLHARRAGRTPDLVLQFDCAGRGRILFGACVAAEIVEPLRRELGRTTPWVGFHTYGEIAPVAGHPYYHNYTVALCAVYERDAA